MNQMISKRNGIMKLLGCVTSIAILWLGVFPQLAKVPPVARHLQTLREANVDAGAVFYSELDPNLFPEESTLARLRLGGRISSEANSPAERQTGVPPALMMHR